MASGYEEKYLKSKYGQQASPDITGMEGQSSNLMKTAQMAGNSTDTPVPGADANSLKPSPEFSQGFSRGAQGGGLGSAVMSGGMATGNPYAIGAGVGLMALEGNAQAEQAEEEAKAIEAQQRKQAQMSAINNLISVTKTLGV